MIRFTAEMKRVAKRLPFFSGFAPALDGVDFPRSAFAPPVLCSRIMRPAAIAVAVVFLVAGVSAADTVAAAALDSVYECTDAWGNRSYQNVPDPSASCRRMDGLVASVPTPERSGSNRVRHRFRARFRHPYPVKLEANFPRISPATQHARDLDRHRLLMDELHTEERRLARLRAEFGRMQSQTVSGNTAGTAQKISVDIERTRENITSLNQELLAGNRY